MSANPSPWGKPRPPEKPPSPYLKYILWIMGLVGAALLVSWLFPGTVSDGGNNMELVYDVLLLALVGSGLVMQVMARPGQALRQLGGWVLIFGVLLLGYSFWNGSSFMGRELDPAQGRVGGRAISFQADMSGHFMVRAKVNGVTVKFLVDTGASDVVLSAKDAQRVGFKLDSLRFDRPYNTANGQVFGAPVTLKEITLGPIIVRNVAGSVGGGEMDGSLLGMSFLNSLSGYEVQGGVLTLYP